MTKCTVLYMHIHTAREATRVLACPEGAHLHNNKECSHEAIIPEVDWPPSIWARLAERERERGPERQPEGWASHDP